MESGDRFRPNQFRPLHPIIIFLVNEQASRPAFFVHTRKKRKGKSFLSLPFPLIEDNITINESKEG